MSVKNYRLKTSGGCILLCLTPLHDHGFILHHSGGGGVGEFLNIKIARDHFLQRIDAIGELVAVVVSIGSQRLLGGIEHAIRVILVIELVFGAVSCIDSVLAKFQTHSRKCEHIIDHVFDSVHMLLLEFRVHAKLHFVEIESGFVKLLIGNLLL